MSTVILSHSETTDLDLICSSTAFIVRYEVSSNISDLKEKIKDCSLMRVRNFGLHLQDPRGDSIRLLNSNDMEITKSSLQNKLHPIHEFFCWLISEVLIEGAFIDFLLTTPIGECAQLCLALQAISNRKISVRLVTRFLSSDLAPHKRQIAEIYINNDKMISNLNNSRANSAHNRYERIRTVGKGAFGSAVLYRRREDSSLVIIKEINMYELDSSQRRLALNEVSLLSRIEHPNIIAYYDSFEEDGVLMIEMEYADGGTLAQLLSRIENLMEEEYIIDMMIQMLSAVGYLHENSVLHRDLKTANIFLTKDSFVKIGDFGISKIMGTETLAQGAKTVVGTPYYISPEMCSGEPYNEKSDMWALGCILYEMCCLKKAFEGDNLPALVNNIMTCTYAPVKSPYSSEIKMVIRELLQLDPQNRPSASSALKMLRPSEIRPKYTSGSIRSSVSWSNLYELHTSSITLSSISRIPSRISIKQISMSETHVLLLTNDNEVFGWGDNSHGQLGIEAINISSETPQLIENLKGRDVHSIGAGNHFSVICCDRGALLTMGNGKYLGLGRETRDAHKPTLIEQLLREHIRDIVCGSEHVIAILENGECYGWGGNQCGQLGVAKIEHIYDATKINNDYVSKATIIQGFPERVVDFSVGSFHCGVILESGQVMLFGRNDNCELGLGNAQKMAVRCVKPVKSLLHHACVKVYCGDGFSLVSTVEQELYFWGRKDYCDPSMFIEDLEESMSDKEKRLLRKTTSDFGDPNVVQFPSLILRLQDKHGDKGIRFSGIVANGKRVLVAVDSLEGRRLPSALAERTRSGSLSTVSEETRTWLREEFENAAIIPIDKRRVRFDTSCQFDANTTYSNQNLVEEIEELKQKIKAQDTTFEGHRIQMSDLEAKLRELQARQGFLRKAEPPPAYDKPNVTYNKLFAENNTSTACTIL